MRLFETFIKYVIIITLPLFIAVNAYTFLISVAPEYNFLSVELETMAYNNQGIEFVCRQNGGVSYFGFRSLLNMLNDFETDRTPKVILGLSNSFYSANFVITETIPVTIQGNSDNVLNILKVLYVVLGYMFQPLFAAGWLVYAIYELAVDVYNFMMVLLHAFAGMYNITQCYSYPQELLAMPYILM